MKRIILFFIAAFFITSCSEKEIRIPDDVLNKKEMADILADIHIAQAAFNNRAKNDTAKYVLNDFVILALKQNKIEKKDFLHSLKFYTDHPEILTQIYDSVITDLSRIQGETEK